MDKNTYSVKFDKFENNNGHTEYTVRVTSKASKDSFTIKDRYRDFRSFWQQLVDEFDRAVPPNFPPKKRCGNMEEVFIRHRMRALETFFNTLLEDQKIANSLIVKNYFDRVKIKAPKQPEEEKQKIPTDKHEETKVEKAPNTTEQRYIPSEKLLKKAVDYTTRQFIDINFNDEPPSIEEIKEKSKQYLAAMDKTSNNPPYITKLLSIPIGNEKYIEGINLELAERENPISSWLDEKMRLFSDVMANKGMNIYPMQHMFTEFKLEA